MVATNFLNQLPQHVVKELSLGADVSQGQINDQVKRVQEWLTFHKFATAIDREFGPATERCVKSFQVAKGLPATGVVDQATYKKLVEPLIKALKEIQPSPNETLGGMVLKYAKQHLAQHPIELGGDNRGPWVRTYMNGNEGAAWRWCAGFVTFILKQACATLDRPMPIPGSFGCDELSRQAKERRLLVKDSSIINNSVSWSTLEPCCIFLVRNTATDWVHTGFAFDKDGDTFETIEGNTNEAGGSNGFEVCKRVRSLDKKDFIRLA